MISPGTGSVAIERGEITLASDRLALALVYASFIFFVFFPYIQLLPLKTDTQPYALLISIGILLAARNRRMPPEVALLLPVFLFSLPVLALGEANFTAARSLANYASVFLIAYASYVLLKAAGGLSVGAFKVIVFTWFVVGFTQTFIYSDFLVFMTPRALGTAGSFGRGVVGLSPEPTHYGTYCIFLLILTMLLARLKQLSRRERTWLLALLLIQIVLFARSAMAVLLLVLFGGIYFGFNFLSPRRLVAGVALLAMLAGMLAWVLSSDSAAIANTRLYVLFTRLLEDPMLVLLIDHSVNDRFFNIFFSFYGFFENFGLPHGYAAWRYYVVEMVPRFSPYAWWVSNTRIMSGYGGSLFELGAVALLVPLSVTVALRRFYGTDVRSFLVMGIFVHLVMLTNVPLAFPLFGFLIGFLAYSARYDPREERSPDAAGEAQGPAPA